MFEEFSKAPNKLKFKTKKNNWKFEKKFLGDLDNADRFNLIFAKCIDHIHDWNKLFSDAYKLALDGAMLVIKHNSFFCTTHNYIHVYD